MFLGLEVGVWLLILFMAVVFTVIGILIGRKRHSEVEDVIDNIRGEIKEAKADLHKTKEEAKTEIVVEAQKAKEEVIAQKDSWPVEDTTKTTKL